MIAMHRLASSHLEFSSKPEEPLQDSSSAKKAWIFCKESRKLLKTLNFLWKRCHQAALC